MRCCSRSSWRPRAIARTAAGRGNSTAFVRSSGRSRQRNARCSTSSSAARLNKQIAIDLGTAERTIKWHRHNLMEKLKVGSLAELVSLAERLGLVGAQELRDDGSN